MVVTAFSKLIVICYKERQIQLASPAYLGVNSISLEKTFIVFTEEEGKVVTFERIDTIFQHFNH